MVRFLLAALLVFAAYGTAQGLPRQGAFARQVTLEASRALPLEAALRLIAGAAGVDLLVGAIPETQVRGSMRGPFWQVFETLIAVYGNNQVSYSLVGNTLVVGPRPAQTVEEVLAPRLRYLGFAKGVSGSLGAVEVGGRVVLLGPGDVLPGFTAFRVKELSERRLVVEGRGRQFVYPLAGEEGGEL